MTKPTKHKVGRFLLLSLIPTGIFLVISLLIGVAMSSGEEPPVNFAAALMLLWILLALPTGLVLLIWGNIEFGRAYKATRQYAERHGWLPISRTSWRNRKANNVSLAVDQAFQKQTYLLKIEGEGETITVDEFESSLWALQFADWLWRELLQTNASPDQYTIAEKRAEWETTALAERSY